MVNDRHFGAGTSGDVTELERDVTAADEQHTRWQDIEFQKLLARDEMLAALEVELGRFRAHRDEDVPPLEHVFSDRNCVPPKWARVDGRHVPAGPATLMGDDTGGGADCWRSKARVDARTHVLRTSPAIYV